MVTRIWHKKCILTEFSQTKTKLITTANQTYGWYYKQPKRSKNTQTASSAENAIDQVAIDWLIGWEEKADDVKHYIHGAANQSPRRICEVYPFLFFFLSLHGLPFSY